MMSRHQRKIGDHSRAPIERNEQISMANFKEKSLVPFRKIVLSTQSRRKLKSKNQSKAPTESGYTLRINTEEKCLQVPLRSRLQRKSGDHNRIPMESDGHKSRASAKEKKRVSVKKVRLSAPSRRQCKSRDRSRAPIERDVYKSKPHANEKSLPRPFRKMILPSPSRPQCKSRNHNRWYHSRSAIGRDAYKSKAHANEKGFHVPFRKVRSPAPSRRQCESGDYIASLIERGEHKPRANTKEKGLLVPFQKIRSPASPQHQVIKRGRIIVPVERDARESMVKTKKQYLPVLFGKRRFFMPTRRQCKNGDRSRALIERNKHKLKVNTKEKSPPVPFRKMRLPTESRRQCKSGDHSRAQVFENELSTERRKIGESAYPEVRMVKNGLDTDATFNIKNNYPACQNIYGSKYNKENSYATRQDEVDRRNHRFLAPIIENKHRNQSSTKRPLYLKNECVGSHGKAHKYVHQEARRVNKKPDTCANISTFVSKDEKEKCFVSQNVGKETDRPILNPIFKIKQKNKISTRGPICFEIKDASAHGKTEKSDISEAGSGYRPDSEATLSSRERKDIIHSCTFAQNEINETCHRIRDQSSTEGPRCFEMAIASVNERSGKNVHQQAEPVKNKRSRENNENTTFRESGEQYHDKRLHLPTELFIKERPKILFTKYHMKANNSKEFNLVLLRKIFYESGHEISNFYSAFDVLNFTMHT